MMPAFTDFVAAKPFKTVVMAQNGPGTE